MPIDHRFARQAELQRFKREINLVTFATKFGYRVDEKSPSYTRLRRAPGDQIIVCRQRDGTYVYVNPANCTLRDPNAPKPRDADQGTIVDFLQREQGIDLGAVRRTLRDELGISTIDDPASSLQPAPEFDRDVVARQLARGKLTHQSQYLAERGLHPDTLSNSRFAGTLRVFPNHEVIFPHHDVQGITGFERKHPRYTLFAKGGHRAFWHSRLLTCDDTLVVAESAIDCLSYHQLHPSTKTRYLSSAGTLSSAQQQLFARAADRLPPHGSVIIATDNDSAGRIMADRLADIVRARRPDLNISSPLPPSPHKDWNDVVKHREQAFIARARSTPNIPL